MKIIANALTEENCLYYYLFPKSYKASFPIYKLSSGLETLWEYQNYVIEHSVISFEKKFY